MVEFPSLVNFKLDTCGEINLEAIKLGRDDGTCQLKSLYIFSKNHMQLPCKWKLHLHNLQSLRLYGCWWHELKSLCFPKLKKLHAVNCGRSALFTISGFRSLQQLERLEIRGCDLLEETLEDARGDEHAGMHTEAITLLQLNSVVFKDLPNLKSFLSGANFECYMLALKNVEVDNCGLPSIFTHSVFRNLQQLETLVVSNCRLLEGIVENEREEETSDTNDKVITLFQLSSVTLKDLPNLRSFSRSVSYALNLPKLNIFRVLGCPLLETFTCMKTSTGLVSVYSEGHEGEEPGFPMACLVQMIRDLLDEPWEHVEVLDISPSSNHAAHSLAANCISEEGGIHNINTPPGAVGEIIDGEAQGERVF
ncbi:hypothetical protein POM88_027220 [Heracleum sosnowskyi]|uniref:Disease resistance protein At4g27190-like leucine-rich repeats domain-containing protein n=1 Tax=Heracleum sosnowskyi TaxID=360622 RepID=A0AAD8MPA4_9APIA|nr:hypothetical protein POM88_027220 [Heracleum sosnowskyi]